ncbi:MAG TPA: hypothetical protein VIT38_01590 [Allosphingosinicella sp.]|jgi:hypothetical protein
MRRRILSGCGFLCLALAAPALAAAKPPARATPPARAAPVTAAELVGRWGDNGDCAKYIVFRSDGAFLSYTGGEGRWSLTGNRLVMTGSGGSFTRRVERINRTSIRITNPDGSVGMSQRCPYSSR